MRASLALLTLAGAAGAALAGLAAPASAQPLPPGSYQSQCRDLRFQGTFLSGSCRRPGGGWAQSAINVPGCQGREIYVGPDGGLACNVNERPITRPIPPEAYPPPGVRPPRPGGDGWGRGSITVYDRRGYRGASQRFDNDVDNLGRSRLNDNIGSIRISGRGAWEVCEHAGYRGRCRIVRNDLSDTRVIGLKDEISSFRRVR
ncbi:MAG: beta/gamma crystallin family protein [Caulobacteraceae bacterium]|nr:beta/gamma crystallin family protein [Caulobacteraceae bacterium]